jgi:hypothetical protein
VSLKPSRIQRSRKTSQWRNQFQPAGEESPSELPRLPACFDDDCLEEDAVEGEASDVRDRADGREAVVSPAGPQDRGPMKVRHAKVAAERGHVEAMYLLAQECEDRMARIHLLTLAAERGHVRAMHDLGLASVALHERRRWLLRAARHGWAEAMAELGDVECS